VSTESKKKKVLVWTESTQAAINFEK